MHMHHELLSGDFPRFHLQMFGLSISLVQLIELRIQYPHRDRYSGNPSRKDARPLAFVGALGGNSRGRARSVMSAITQ